MSGSRHYFFTLFLRRQEGAVAVEMALILTLFLTLIGGLIDFGDAWYMQQVVTNASREGARYGITYQTDTNGNRIAPSALSPTIQNYVLNNYLTGNLPADANPTVTVTGSGYTTGTKGSPVQVQVTATKPWYILSGFVPGLGNSINLTGSTVMLCE